MIASRLGWPTWGMLFQIRRLAISCVDTTSHLGARAEPETTWKEFIRSHMDVLAGVDFFTVEMLTWRGLITFYVLYRDRQSPGVTGRHHGSPGRVLDGAGRAKRDNGRDRVPKQLSVSAARSRCQILQRFPQHARGGRHAVPGPIGEEPKSEFLRGTLGTFGERGVPVYTDLVRGELLAARGIQIL